MMNSLDLQQVRREEMRGKVLELLQSSPDPIALRLIGAGLLKARFDCTHEDVRATLRYLAGKNLVNLDKDTWAARISADGLDVLERTIECPVGLYLDGSPPTLNEHEVARGCILAMLVVSDKGWSERSIDLALDKTELYLEPSQVRICLNYLEDKGLIGVDRSDRSQWWATITSMGTDVAQGAQSCPPGIRLGVGH